MWPPGEGGHKQLMVVSLRISAGDKGVGRQPPRCDGNLEGRRFSRVRGSVGWGEGFKDKGKGWWWDSLPIQGNCQRGGRKRGGCSSGQGHRA